eukprot:CAMPEP_0173389598 /NCGR_PEP_ID=MMETSP1356-20130122/12680_1 /TAXON_ID=77927 ORGANISM="Hemiselmis virescens, Strain PCC157" /NCGR_SAMPLE_ID=MMETSP1356 /ASSEMBLY_ACC=CAM_ASM_000847 /LENGTH=491 /DNA_ID=CAMNT_0014346805 /DNA_START=114 /DNA_END=1589 /DNA_ORIENTATION=+
MAANGVRAPKKQKLGEEADITAMKAESARVRGLMPKCDEGFNVREAVPNENEEQAFETFAIYNRKGGVAKTTVSHSLAWTLAQRGNRVLIVDADPQCDMSMLLLRDYIKTTLEADVPEVEKTGDLNLFYEKGKQDQSKNNMFAGIEPMTLPAGGDNPDATAIDVMEIYCDSLNKTTQAKPEDRVPHGGALFLAPGHHDLEDFGMNLASAMKSCLGRDSLAPGSWYYCLKQTAKKYSINVIIQDCSPSAGALSLNAVMCADYLICPCSPDLLSLSAIKHMDIQYKKWTETMQELVDAQEHQDLDENYRVRTKELPAGPGGGVVVHLPVFLGITITRYIPVGTAKDGTRIKADKIAHIIEQFQKTLDEKAIKFVNLKQHSPRVGIVPAQHHCARMISPENKPAILLDMNDFRSLTPLSQYHGVPVVVLGGNTLTMPDTVKTSTTQNQEFIDTFSVQMFRFMVRIWRRQTSGIIKHDGIDLDQESVHDLNPFEN